MKRVLWWLYRLATIPLGIVIFFGPVFFWASLGIAWFPSFNNHVILAIIAGPVVLTYHFGWQWLNPRIDTLEGRLREWSLKGTGQNKT